MPRKTLYFTAPYAAEVRTASVPDPGPHEVRVRTTYSAISAGTELLVYRGQASREDRGSSLDPISGQLDYPVVYGYSAVGVVDAVGRDVDPEWKGRRVFGFQPHTSHFCCTCDELIALPETIGDRDAVFIPNMETAVNLVMDACPLIGERVLVLGQGVVGLLTTALLRRFPLEVLATADRYAARRSQSLELGADEALDPAAASTDRVLRRVLNMDEADSSAGSGADLIVELTGEPAALNDALRYAGFESRIVVGSWYGSKRANLDLGGKFHRYRIRLVSSQVSTLASERQGRWDKGRRMDVVLSQIDATKPSKMITDIYPIDHAPEAFERLDASPHNGIQFIFSYEHGG